jgi:hypothetical protein
MWPAIAVKIPSDQRISVRCSMPVLRISPALFGLLCLSVSTRAQGAGLEGTWKWSWTDQGGTEHQRVLKIRKEEGKLSGVVIQDGGSESGVKDLAVEGDRLSFSNEVSRDGQVRTIKYEGKIEGDVIRGKIEVGGQTRDWEAKREASAGGKEEWIELIHGKTIAESGWKLRNPPDANHKDGWSLKDGILSNKAPSIDLIHEKNFKDFDLHVEFRYPKGSNSGVYLRGIYEVQVEDTYGQDKRDTMCGAIYGQKAPSVNAARPAGEWQTFDIHLSGNKVTVIHNEQKVIDDFELKGPTGGALNIKHGEPGPIRLQGDHGDVEYRNIRIKELRRLD